MYARQNYLSLATIAQKMQGGVIAGLYGTIMRVHKAA